MHDAAATFSEAVASILYQTLPPFEIIVVDDGSEDGTLQLASAWAARDPRIRVLPGPRRGLVAALNRGLQHARTRYVARMDADDISAPRRLELQVRRMDADPRLGVVDGRVSLFREGEPVPRGMACYARWVNGILSPADFDRALLVESPVIHPAALLRRRAVMASGGYRHGPFPEDYDLWLRMHAAGWRFQKVPEVVLRMRDRPDRLTRTDPRYRQEGFRRVRRAWLRATVLRHPRQLAVWGAGREGGRWIRWCQEEGHEVVAAVDVDPRKVGGRRHGVSVVPPEALPRLEVELMLVAVGARGARALIRERIRQLRPDWEEGRDWWALR